MSNELILKAETGPVLEAILNRPKKLNAINLEMAEGLFALAREFAARDDLRVMLIRAQGKYFSAGADINGGLFPGPNVTTPSEFRRWYRGGVGSLHPFLDELEAIEKPIVVAHQGPCLGGGLELSLSCDFRLAGRSARYALPETTLGSIPGSGGVSRLTRSVGPQWTKWFVMANLDMSAERALAIGLVHEVYDDERLEASAMEFCQHLARQPPETVAASKLAIELVADLDRAQARNVERLTNSSLVFGREHDDLLTAMRDRLRGK